MSTVYPFYQAGPIRGRGATRRVAIEDHRGRRVEAFLHNPAEFGSVIEWVDEAHIRQLSRWLREIDSALGRASNEEQHLELIGQIMGNIFATESTARQPLDLTEYDL